MENATKALLISGGILLAIMVLSIGVVLFNQFSGSGEAYETSQTIAETRKFNNNFTKFEDRGDITAQEIVTLKEFVKQYNDKNGTNVQVITSPNFTDNIDFLKEYSVNEDAEERILFKCDSNKIEYDDEGRVKKIEFQE